MKKENQKNKKISEFKKLNMLDNTKILKHIDFKWIFTIFTIAFIVTFLLSFISDRAISNSGITISVIVLILFILIGVIFDMIGVSVTAAKTSVFHSMNSRKVKGADIAVILKNNADKVSSFCCDVIGDICATISGSAGVYITLTLVNKFNYNALFTTLIMTALIASLTISGKAIGKSFAINKCDVILYEFSKFISIFVRKK